MAKKVEGPAFIVSSADYAVIKSIGTPILTRHYTYQDAVFAANELALASPLKEVAVYKLIEAYRASTVDKVVVATRPSLA